MVHGKELPVPKGWNSWFPTWEPWVTIASNCRLPEVRTHASQPGNHGLPLQTIAGSQRLELIACQPGNHRLPLQRTSGSYRLGLMFSNVGTKGYHGKELPVSSTLKLMLPNLGTKGCQPGNQRLPLQGIAGSQKLEFMFSKLNNYHCKELPVAKA